LNELADHVTEATSPHNPPRAATPSPLQTDRIGPSLAL
jgi:hypothetical protein